VFILTTKKIHEMTTQELQGEIRELRQRKIWERSDQETERLAALGHALELAEGRDRSTGDDEEVLSDVAANELDRETPLLGEGESFED